MKTPDDPRHRRRQFLIQELFKRDFHKQEIDKTAEAIYNKLEDIDSLISRIAPEFPIEKINKVDLAILRLGVYELVIEKKEPPHVIIDEAVELAKEFGGESSPAFINGALGKVTYYEKTSNV